MIYLVEHFYSIQGEGKYVGRPSVFFRFGGCNMRCEGFGCIDKAKDGSDIVGCDTIYAVNRENFSSNWNSIKSSKELLDILDEYHLPKQPVDIVLTGGEPLIYANEAVFVEFLDSLITLGHRVCFETNGSLNVDFLKYPIYTKCIFALSIKLKNAAEPLSKRINEEVITSLCTYAKEAFFKFSIDEKSINSEVDHEIESIIKISPKTEIYCMPIGGSKEEIERNSEPLVEFCKLKGYNFSDRLHMRIWDKEKGV